MKTNKKQLLTALILGVVMVILFVGGCKKETSSSGAVPKPDITMSREGAPGKIEALHVSPSGDLILTMKSPSVKRVFPDLQAKEKINAELRESKKKKKAESITTSNVTFTATNQGTYYTCYGEVPSTGLPHDWYLIDWYTNVYTYIGTSSDNTINFNVQKPSLYGQYRLWAEGPGGASFTGYQYLGDPYSGVTISGGILSLTDVSAYDALKTRLKTAYDNHQTHLDSYSSMSSDNAEAQAISDGFDEFLPFKRFEAHFGLSSLRAKIRGEVVYWQSQSNEDGTGYPEDSYVPYSYEQQTLMNASGQIQVGGVGEGPMTLPLTAGGKTPSNPGPNTCMSEADMAEGRPVSSVRKLKMYVYIDPVTTKGNTSTVFAGRTRTMKRQAGFLWKDKLEKQQVKVSGIYYNGCTYENTFDSGYSNPGNKFRYKEDVDYPVGAGRTTKSGEITTSALLSEHAGSTPYTLTYTH